MDKKRKAAAIAKILNRCFPDPEIPLKHSDPFTLLIATLLSAQATDAAVNKVTPRLFQRAPTPFKMAELEEAEVRELIRTIGLFNTKAKAIVKLSRMLVDGWGGEVPSTFEELESLPGVGHKTASVVMCQAFHKPAFPVDTHIHRLAKRWGLSRGKDVKETEVDLKAVFPKSKWAKLHLQMIYFGRTFCKARNHLAEECPICTFLKSDSN
ncbi:endonuclease III [Estrella lausannensis]|uniref:Endonuclease III n=1 Tax=Estrella lausannensis TaxID=483423 RepID=A0A0H5DQH9_9BACT|nr:endonuclease III [Estrella lausannensis]CRX38787.1 Endonuclease III [Estrella lausannensis]